MKYCILSNNPPEIETVDLVGFYQWVNVFKGDLLLAANSLPLLKDGDYDVIHVLLNQENMELIQEVRKKIGQNSETIIVATIETCIEELEEEFGELSSLYNLLEGANLITATEYSIVKKIEGITGMPVWELAHPADIDGIRARKVDRDKRYFLLLGEMNQEDLSTLRNYTVTSDVEEKTVPENCNEKRLIELICSSKIMVNECKNANYGREIIYAAALDCLVLGNLNFDSSRRCFPNTFFKECEEKPATICYYMNNLTEEYAYYFQKEASRRVEFYNYGNMHKRFLNILRDQIGTYEKFDYRNQFVRHEHKANIFHNITKVYGNECVDYGKNDFAVVCLLKNAGETIESFLDYYRKLGASHFFFIDNDSRDDTKNKLLGHVDVTLYHTELKHKEYESEIRKSIIEHNCRNKWCLYVDDDEFFDFPGSESISMSKFIDYLNVNGYTSVLGYMLDMFADKEAMGNKNLNKDLDKNYPYCDISNIAKEKYAGPFQAFCYYNEMEDVDYENYYGGIRDTIFDLSHSRLLLTKHSLIHIGRNVDAVIHPHFSNKVNIADVSAIVKHYKFTTHLAQKVINRLEEESFEHFTSVQYREYDKVLKTGEEISLVSESSFKLGNATNLVGRGFLHVSERYSDFVNNNAELTKEELSELRL